MKGLLCTYYSIVHEALKCLDCTFKVKWHDHIDQVLTEAEGSDDSRLWVTSFEKVVETCRQMERSWRRFGRG